MIALIDNYDSFTYNLVDLIQQQGVLCKVFRNDALSLDQWIKLNPKAIIISPGPGLPKDAGMLMQIIEHFHHRIPILGICLGHQALAQYFGAELKHAIKPMHGKTSEISHSNHQMYAHVPNNIEMMRYHSWVVNSLPETLLSTGKTKEGEIMSFAHKTLKIWAVQYHPESILSLYGPQIIKNWINEFELN